jgi:hypothetical protein
VLLNLANFLVLISGVGPFVSSTVMNAHPQQSVVVGKTRLMVPAQQITLVTNGVAGEQREGNIIKTDL